VPNLSPGRIFIAMMEDPHGGSPKPRPVVVLDGHDRDPADPYTVAVCSSSAIVETPNRFDLIAIPTHPSGKSKSKLKKPTAAVCSWVRRVDPSVIDPNDLRGSVESGLLQMIRDKVEEIDSKLPGMKQ
jgi:hypothetical protein